MRCMEKLKVQTNPKIFAARIIVFLAKSPVAAPFACALVKASTIETPTMNKKNGKIKSVGVQPCQGACCNGPYIYDQEPGLLTKIIAATVAPRKKSKETKRLPEEIPLSVVIEK